MVGAAGIVASAVNNSRQRRESRASRRGSDDNNNNSAEGRGRLGSRATISEILASRHMLAVGSTGPGGGGIGGSMNSQKSVGSTYTQHLHPSNNNNNNKEPVELPPEKMSMAEQIKFYVSLTLGIIATLCVFALLFLIPLVVEPSISTLFADFDSEAATCVTTRAEEVSGLTKCGAYSSCREGCTSTPHQCIQINVHYRKANKPGFRRIKNFTVVNDYEINDESHWDAVYTQLFINAKGCGYPPKVVCDDFKSIYGKVGVAFPCFYSRANPRLVITDYNWEETAYPLIFSLGIPTGLFTISIGILSVWYCPSCEERGKNKRPCRSRYIIPRPTPEDILHRDKKQKKEEQNNRTRNQNQHLQVPQPPPQPIIQQQPQRRKHSLYRPNSPSLATISSGDTTISSMSVNSIDSGWNSPPSPPPRTGSRMNNSSKSNLSTRTRKL